MIADNRLDAFVHATFGNAPARLLRAARGNNALLALVLGFPELAMPAVSQATASRSDAKFLGLPFAEGTPLKAVHDFERFDKNSPTA